MAMLLQSSMIPEFLAVVLVLFTLLYFHVQKAYKYWKNKNVPYVQPKTLLGSTKSWSASYQGVQNQTIYNEFKSKGHKFGGLFVVTRPILMLTDLDYVRDILSKDFHNFIDRGFYYNEKDDPISANLFAINENKWKFLRTSLTPTFTSGKMKMMFDSVIDCSKNMTNAIEELSLKNEAIDIREILAKFTTDVIGCCAFGLNCNSFNDPNAKFRKMGKDAFKFSIKALCKRIVILANPELAVKLGFRLINKDISDFFYETIEETIEYRKKNNISRPDFLQLLMDMKDSDDNTKKLTMWELVSQVFLFFVAGFDTSSTTMNFTLYELAKNSDIQQRVREEINSVLSKYDDKITYESLSEMTYLQQVIDESMRIYPPVTSLIRNCTKDYQLRDSDVVLEKGTSLVIPVYAIHNDPDIYPNPKKFDPERFSPENKAKRHPFAFLPFGGGPRNCIGLRFGRMQSKIGIATIIRNYELSVSPETKGPLNLDPRFFLLKSIETLYLSAKKINKEEAISI